MKKILPILVVVMFFVAGGVSYFAYTTYTDNKKNMTNDELNKKTVLNNESENSEEENETLQSTEANLKDHYEKGEYIYAIEHFKNIFIDSSSAVQPNEEILSIYNKVVYAYFDSIDEFNEDIFLRVQEKNLTKETVTFLYSKFENDIVLSQKNNKNQQTEFAKKQEENREQREIEERSQQGVRIGMTKEEVLMSNWGEPKDINKTTNAYGTSEQWVYRNNNYLYFEDGILVTIQN